MLAYHLQNHIGFFDDELHLNGENLFFSKFFDFGRSVRMKCFLTYRTWNNYIDLVRFLEIKEAINQAAFPFGVVKCVRIKDVSRRWVECIYFEFSFLRFGCRKYRFKNWIFNPIQWQLGQHKKTYKTCRTLLLRQAFISLTSSPNPIFPPTTF